ncbi:MAG: mannosyltransferase family protein [Chloroflexi bacterium]|nr:mannosyltransferase family protein [Chloroflexota bacterium]
MALAALVVGPLVPRNPALTSAAGGPLLAQLTSWDGWWYLGIARDGYHAAPLTGQYHDYAFFPLYPALVRALSLATPAFDGLIAVLLSNVLFLVALGLLYRLTAEVLDEERAAWSCVVLCLFPFSFVFSMAYAESLFLALSLGALLAAERGHAATASLLAGLAGLTRLPGVLLVVPLALILWKRLDDRRALAWLVLVPLGAVAFTAWVGTFAGAAGGFGGAQAAWGRNGIGAAAAIGGNLASQLDPLRLSFLVALLAYVFLLVYLRPDRIPLPYATIPILTLAAVLMSGDLESVGRYGMVAFPFVWVLAGRRRFRAPWTALSAVLLLAASVAAFSGRMTP